MGQMQGFRAAVTQILNGLKIMSPYFYIVHTIMILLLVLQMHWTLQRLRG